MKNTMIVLALTLSSLATPTWAIDKDNFEKLANSSIQQVLSGKDIDADAMIKDQKELIKIAIAGCKTYIEKHPEDSKLLQLVMDNAATMQSLSLEEIEEQWHEYGVLTSKGFDTDAFEQFSPAISLMDSIVHPATAVIVLNNYKKDGDSDALLQIKDELAEVLEHLHYIL